MQLRLVRDDTAKVRRAVAFVRQGEVTEPRRPVLVEVPVDPKLVAGRRLSSSVVPWDPHSRVHNRVRGVCRSQR